jgi:perosamine synthetase
MKVPAQAYDVSEADIEAVTSEFAALMQRGGFLTMGDHVEHFEEAFAKRHGTAHAAATNSGTAALEAILRALDVAGGEVVVPTNTFAATAFAVLHAGATPVFADIRPDLTVDPDDVMQRVTSRTRAVVTVHIGGLVSSATPELARRCGEAGIPLVEDAAHAHGSSLDGRSAGTFGVAGAFSFFSTKVMTMGEGGAVVTDDPEIDRTVRLLRDQAKNRDNRHDTLGHNWRLTEVQAMLGLRQLDRLDEFIDRRGWVAERYEELLADTPGLEFVPTPEGGVNNHYKWIALVDGVEPDHLKQRLKDEHAVSLGGYVYELPLHEQPAFHRFADGPRPVAEDLCRRHICPPIYPSLTSAQVEHVANALRQELHATRS